MGWNCTIAVVPDATLADLNAAGVPPQGSPLTGDGALSSSFQGVAAGERSGSVVLVCSDMSLLDGVEQLSHRLGRRTVASASFGSTGDTWVWQVHGAGADRTWVWQSGEVVVDEGPAMDQEQAVEQLDEDGLFTLLAAVTGFTVDDDFLRSSCQPVTWPPM